MRRVTALLFFACGGEPATTTPHVVASASASASPLPSVTAEQCATGEYSAQPTWSGRAASLPAPPLLPVRPMHDGDAYTVYGAVHTLHSEAHRADLESPITIVGYIVDTNLPRAPKCLLHHTGRADPQGCPAGELPTFTIADEAASPTTQIRVMGWASNWANVYEAYLAQKKGGTTPYLDELWAVPVPSPLPAVRAKVRVTGRYAMTFARSSMGLVTDRRNGIVTIDHMTYLEPPPVRVVLPQLGP